MYNKYSDDNLWRNWVIFMKKAIKIFTIFTILILCFSCIVNATDPTSNMKPEVPTNDSLITPLLNTILGIVQVVAIGVTAISVVVLAIRYMYTSVNEKATIKQQMMPIIIGSALIFGAISLVRLVGTFASEAFK